MRATLCATATLMCLTLPFAGGCARNATRATDGRGGHSGDRSVRGNLITALRTEDDPQGPTIVFTVEVAAARELDAFMPEVIHRVLLQRMTSPPDTARIRALVLGDISAEQFSRVWQKHLPADPAMAWFMSKMTNAEVIQEGPHGRTSYASLLSARAANAIQPGVEHVSHSARGSARAQSAP